MTPSQQAKTAGLDGLAHLVKVTKVPERTLTDWFKNRPERFQLAIDGARWRIRHGN